MIELYINGQLAQLSESIDVVFNKIVSDLNDPTKKTGSYSYTFTIPYTKVNNLIFNRENDRQKIGKFRGVYLASVYYSDTLIFEGQLVHKENTQLGYGCFLSATKDLKIASIIGDGSIQDINSFTPIPFSGDATVHEYLGKDLFYVPGNQAFVSGCSEIAFTLVPNGYAKVEKFKEYYQTFYTVEGITYAASYEDYGLSVFTGAIFENIFKDAGYSISGDILSREDFKRMILLYSSNGKNEYNYSVLNPFSASTLQTTRVYQVLTNPDGIGTSFPVSINTSNLRTTTLATQFFRHINCSIPYLNVTSGDLSFSLQTPGGVVGNSGSTTYTCKHSGTYTFNLNYAFQTWETYISETDGKYYTARRSDFNATNRKYEVFFAFREITEVEFLEVNSELNPGTDAIFFPDEHTKYSTYLPANSGDFRILQRSFTAELEEGKQYQFQFYYTSRVDHFTIFERFLGFSEFAVTRCTGNSLINPADFLPDLKKIDFVNSIFKLFNLFYQIDSDTKTITFFSRDDFFELNKSNTIDLSKRLNLNEFTEEPFPDDTVLASQFRYANDSRDYVLKTIPSGQTQTYYDLVNSGMDPAAKAISFAPLTFVRKDWESDSGLVFPATLPFVLTTGNYNLPNLRSIAYSNGFDYTPRVALFYGGYYNEDYYLSQGSAAVLPVGKFVRSGIAEGRSIPHLTFYSLDKQPVYQLDSDYKLLAVTGFTFTTDNRIVGDSGLTETMNTYGLDLTTNEESITQRLYKQTFKNLDLSHLSKGDIKMDALLFKNMSGRELLVIDSDIYLLDRIEKFNPETRQAQITIFKLIT